MKDETATIAVTVTSRDELASLKEYTGLPMYKLIELSLEPLKEFLIEKGLING